MPDSARDELQGTTFVLHRFEYTQNGNEQVLLQSGMNARFGALSAWRRRLGILASVLDDAGA